MNKCPLCNAVNNELIFTNSRGNKYLENYVCNDCGFIFTFPRISNEEINKLYKEGGFSIDARKSTEPDLNKFIQTEIWALERIHFLEKKISEFFLNEKKCFEIGCGTGSFMWFLKSRGHKVKGIEPDAVFVNVAKKRYKIDVESVLYDDYTSEVKFDMICNFHVIEHVLDPRAFVKKMFNQLAENGIIYLECPTIDNIYTNDLNTFFWDVHVNTFSNITLPWLLESEGFAILDVSLNRGFVSVIAQKGTEKRFNKDKKERIIEIIKQNTSTKKVSVNNKGPLSSLKEIIRKFFS